MKACRAKSHHHSSQQKGPSPDGLQATKDAARAHRQGAGWPVYSPPIADFAKDYAMKRLLLPFLALAVLCSALAGCGQKGPLYLPDDEKTTKERDKDVFL
ncbi:hypothetical protein GCM10007363_07900 [Pseudomonas fluvialis]|uniref:Lipopeptide n=2 Tax=Pseudomonas fluvialis TaxID=1793966 RepID=A0ABQ2AH23_9PSED|nr:hypothetical protein GCM10007363_07900 [Pseudomonas fluvialis]